MRRFLIKLEDDHYYDHHLYMTRDNAQRIVDDEIDLIYQAMVVEVRVDEV